MTLENIIGLYTQDENLEKLYELNKKLLRILLLASPVMDDNFSQYKIYEAELGENIENIDEQIMKENAKQHLNEYLSIADDEFAKNYITFRLGKNEDTGNYILRYASLPNEEESEVVCASGESSERHTFKIGVDIKPEDKENFRFLLKLHGALKKERNNTNHALEGEDRLPLTIVNRAIKIYIDLCNNLFVNE
jgi:hypothetical protein